jgi:Ser/Thr protein kinase RdoA (MazF antagonist)
LYPSGHCRALNSLENRVFDIGLDDGSHVVAKFYRPGRWNRQQIAQEHDFLFDLKDAEIPVLYPIAFPDGETIQSREGISYAIWPLTGGREPAEFSDEELGITGRLLARIHNVGAMKKADHRLDLSAKLLGIDPLEYLTANHFIPEALVNDFDYVVRKTVEVYQRESEGVPVHRIHGDCHIGNLLFGRSGWYFLDFDDFYNGPAVQDVWMISSGRDAGADKKQQVFLDAYRLFRDFDDAWLKLVEPLRSLRLIHFSGWIARRWSDPAFPAAFPHFGTEDYWLREVQDLKEQVSLYEGANKRYFIMGEETENPEELSNKDYFWDMDS